MYPLTVECIVESYLSGVRIDSFLAKHLRNYTSWRLHRMVSAGLARVDDQPTEGSTRVFTGQRVSLRLVEPPDKLLDPEAITVKIVYEDPWVIVVDKPVGCAAHPSPGWMGPTVVGALTAAGYTISTSGPAERAGIVHRLDVGTSGLMIVAKSDRAYKTLKDAFRDHEVEKIYHALVQGHMDPVTGTIDAPIDRHPKEDHRFAVIAEGKESITHYEVIEFYRSVSLVKVELETGRTHQIRVHFSALNHPLVGDTTYGADPVLGKSLKMSRPWLHALELRFAHPVTKEPLVFNAPYAPDLQTCLGLLSDAVLP